MNKHVKQKELSAHNEDHSGLRLVRPQNKTYALGLSADVTAKQRAFGNIGFAEWSSILSGQIARNHYFFVVDDSNAVVGFAGWALAPLDKARAWLEQRDGLDSDDCSEGDCVILNAWIADSPEIQRFMIRHAKHELDGQKFIFAKRIYSDGRVRPVELPISDIEALSDSSESL